MHRKAPYERWLFINEVGHPDNHFLRKLKHMAKRAGLNCGQRRAVLTEGQYDKRKKIELSCLDRPVANSALTLCRERRPMRNCFTGL